MNRPYISEAIGWLRCLFWICFKRRSSDRAMRNRKKIHSVKNSALAGIMGKTQMRPPLQILLENTKEKKFGSTGAGAATMSSAAGIVLSGTIRSEEHTSELQSL